MTRVLIVGGSGMLGHKLWQRLDDRFQTYVTLRGAAADYARYRLFDPGRTIDRVEVTQLDEVRRAFDLARPDVVINAAGVVKQSARAQDTVASIAVNSVFPHRLADLCESRNARMIQISTDCVFSGRKGMYHETDAPDPEDMYGRSKVVGEIDGEQALTLRTSIIGRELSGAQGLVEWFLSQRGRSVRGYRRAVFSGVTTSVLSDLIGDIIEMHPALSGLYHVAGAPVSKYDLLHRLREAYGIDVQIEADDEVCLDRSLDGSRLRAAVGWQAPSWSEMVGALASDTTPYERWRAAPAGG